MFTFSFKLFSIMTDVYSIFIALDTIEVYPTISQLSTLWHHYNFTSLYYKMYQGNPSYNFLQRAFSLFPLNLSLLKVFKTDYI